MRERPTPRQTFVQIRGDFLRKGDAVQPGLPDGDRRERRAAQAADAARPGEVARRRREPADGPRDGQPRLAEVLRPRAGRDRERLRHAGQLPHAPGAARLAGGRVPRERLERQEAAPADRHVARPTGSRPRSRPDLAEKDPRNLLLGRQIAAAARSRDHPRRGAVGERPARRRRSAGRASTRRSRRRCSRSRRASTRGRRARAPDRYRRGMYTFIWRQSQHPLLTTFDAADAQVACTRRNRSNTPLQALHLANDPAFVEFADGAGRAHREGRPGGRRGADRRSRSALCFARDPTPAEARPACWRTSTRSSKTDPNDGVDRGRRGC